MTTTEQRQQRGALIGEMRQLIAKADGERRDLTSEEQTLFDALDGRQGRLAEEIDPRAPGPRYARDRAGLDAVERAARHSTDSGLRPMPGGGLGYATAARGVARGEVRLLAPSESLRDHVAVALPDGIRPEELSFGRAVAGVVTGSWRGREAEQRVMATAGVGSGGALVPSVLSARVIDAARAQAVCIRAGAMTMPMDAGEVDMARVAQDPTAAWKGENAAATVSDVALERLVLRARTLVGLVKASVELVEDAANAGSVIEDSLAASLALALDFAALRGQAAGEGPTMPLGIRATAGINTVAVAGAVAHDHFSSAVQAIATANGPSAGLAVVMHPRTAGVLDRSKDGNGLHLPGPPSWQALAKFTTTALPIDLAPGTATEPTVGFFPALTLGMRTELQIEASRVAADPDGSAFRNLQVWIRAYLRADVLVTRETWFTVLTGVTS